MRLSYTENKATYTGVVSIDLFVTFFPQYKR